MKIIIFSISSILLLSCASLKSTDKDINKNQWHLKQVVKDPESTYYHKQGQTLFVSSISGGGQAKDQNGWISTLSPNGEVRAKYWVAGLNGPKGMRAHKGILWVADINEVIGIRISNAKMTHRIFIPEAVFLNDVAIDDEGIVYVSDTLAGKIYKVEGNKWSIFITGKFLEGPNGLLVKGDKLYVAGWGQDVDSKWGTSELGRLYTINLKTKEINFITQEPLGNLDGLELDNQGNFIVSDWMAGKIFRVSPNGQAKLIHQGKKGVADIGFIPENNIVTVPQMLEHGVYSFPLPFYR